MKKIVCMLVLLVLTSVLAIAQSRVVTGRVVDEQGQPMKNAMVGLTRHPLYCKGCLDSITEGLETTEGGIFGFGYSVIQGAKKVTIFIESETPQGYYRLLAVFGTESFLPAKYRGIDIITKNKREINLGDLSPSVTHVKCLIDLSKYINSNDYQDFTEIKIGLRDLRNKILTNPHQIPNEFWENNTTVKLAMPKGKSILTLNYLNKEKRAVRKSLLMKINSASEITVREIISK